MRLWIETAQHAPGDPACGVASTFQREGRFYALLASDPRAAGEGDIARAVTQTQELLRQGAPFDVVVDALLADLPANEHVPCAVLLALAADDPARYRASLVECDAPPLFLTRGGQLLLPPVLEEVRAGHLVRMCEFDLRLGDYLALVGDRAIRARGWSRRWGWQEIAASTRRLTDTGCDAAQLLGALVRMYRRLAEAAGEQAAPDVCMMAMHVRPMRTATIWTGPPSNPELDAVAMQTLLAEAGTRVICGDTTAQIAARLLETSAELESRPGDDRDGNHPWAEVPPVSHLDGIDLVTEGRITLAQARARIARVGQGDLDALQGEDGAARLARVLLGADRVHFVLGQAPVPERVTAPLAVPGRQELVESLRQELESRGKVVSLEAL
ncbi:MAG: hypothetical protein GX601_06920 [Anaerolineales bacterium]|nr:hypothetical protein [Anaerolineales bacterium]